MLGASTSKTRRQKDLRTFFSSPSLSSSRKRRRSTTSRNGSSFEPCPLCGVSFPWHLLERHASDCNGNYVKGESTMSPTASVPTAAIQQEEDAIGTVDGAATTAVTTSPPAFTPKQQEPRQDSNAVSSQGPVAKIQQEVLDAPPISFSNPIPGLFVFEHFLTQQEEGLILDTLGDNTRPDFLPWNPSRFNGKHFGKRWGVHCNLRTRTVTPTSNPLPWFFQEIVLPRMRMALKKIPGSTWTPNEANAIDYRRQKGHYLDQHVDNRQLSKEIIANLSLAGDCCMTFRNLKTKKETKVLLKRRCLQILTEESRYDHSHGIRNADLWSDRRVSLTLRESPLTGKAGSKRRAQPTLLEGLLRKRKGSG